MSDKAALADNLAAGIDQAGLVRLARPVDASEPSRIVDHRSLFHSQSGHRDARHSLYWRSGRYSPPDVLSRPTCRGTRPPQALKAREAMGGSRQAGPVQPAYRSDQLNGHAEGYRGLL